jgi:hypothetical protein
VPLELVSFLPHASLPSHGEVGCILWLGSRRTGVAASNSYDVGLVCVRLHPVPARNSALESVDDAIGAVEAGHWLDGGLSTAEIRPPDWLDDGADGCRQIAESLSWAMEGWGVGWGRMSQRVYMVRTENVRTFVHPLRRILLSSTSRLHHQPASQLLNLPSSPRLETCRWASTFNLSGPGARVRLRLPFAVLGASGFYCFVSSIARFVHQLARFTYGRRQTWSEQTFICINVTFHFPPICRLPRVIRLLLVWPTRTLVCWHDLVDGEAESIFGGKQQWRACSRWECLT